MADTKGWVSGDWNAYCDYCGSQYLASELETDYWGFKACHKDFTLPNPQMFVRVVPEKITVPWSRPVDGAQAFTGKTYQTLSGGQLLGTGPDPGDPTTTLWILTTDTSGDTANCQLPLQAPSRAANNIEIGFTFVNAGTGSIFITKDINQTTQNITGWTAGGPLQSPNNFIMPGETQYWVAMKANNTWKRLG